MNDLTEDDISFYKKKFGDNAPILEDELDYFLYNVWAICREPNGMAMTLIHSTVFKYAKSEKINELYLLELIKQVEGFYHEYSEKKS